MRPSAPSESSAPQTLRCWDSSRSSCPPSLPAIRVVAVPSEKYATIIGDLYQVFDTSDLPGGVVNIVAGRPAELAKTLAEHDDIDAIWCFRDPADATLVKAASIGNLKQVWTNDKYDIDWFDAKQSERKLLHAPRYADQEHLGSLWRVTRCTTHHAKLATALQHLGDNSNFNRQASR